MDQQALPIFPTPGSRVRVPDPESRIGATMLTWTKTEARPVGGRLSIKCAGAGEVPAGRVKPCQNS